MNWIVKTSSFKYCGEPVTRTTYVYNTPLGQFRAYEAVNGTTRYKHPFRKIDGADPFNEIMPDIGILAKSLEDAKTKCEEIWEKVKSKINEY